MQFNAMAVRSPSFGVFPAKSPTSGGMLRLATPLRRNCDIHLPRRRSLRCGSSRTGGDVVLDGEDELDLVFSSGGGGSEEVEDLEDVASAGVGTIDGSGGNMQFRAMAVRSPLFVVLPKKSPISGGMLRLATPIRRNSDIQMPRRRLMCCVSSRTGGDEVDLVIPSGIGGGSEDVEDPEDVDSRREEMATQSIWSQILEIVKFSGPATGLWICGPLMSLIDTAIIGQGSSTELAALGPGTVLCDNMSYVFMFLSIATSNLVATSLARQDEREVQHQISILLFVGLACGVLMLLFTKSLGAKALTAFTGPNVHLVPAANKYVQIRGLAWPAVLIGWVAQSASLGMKDSWGPLKSLVVASTVNVIGHVVLCTCLGYGIAGAAWATMASQIIAAFMMVDSLNKKGYNGYAIEVPSIAELVQIFTLAAPVFLTIASKVAFYSMIIYFATSMGTHMVAAHQVMIQMFSMCVVWGEPLSQTAQSFMPEMLYGVDRSLEKARTLLKSLLIIGVSLGLVLGAVGTSVPWLFPKIFTSDPAVTEQMHKVLIPFFISLCVTPCAHSCEGTLLCCRKLVYRRITSGLLLAFVKLGGLIGYNLLISRDRSMAGRDLKFISLTMSGCFIIGSLLLLLVSSQGLGLQGCWYALVAFQWARFSLSAKRLLSPTGVLFSGDMERYGLAELKAA